MKTLKNKLSILSAAVSKVAVATKRSLILSVSSPFANDLYHKTLSPLLFLVVRKAETVPETS